MKELTLLQFKRKRVNKFHRDLVGMFGKLPNPSAVVGTVDTSWNEFSNLTIKPKHIS